MKSLKIYSILSLILFLGLSIGAWPSSAQTTYSASILNDATISAAQPDSNYGDMIFMDVFTYLGTDNIRRSVLQFDLSAVPDNAHISSAYLNVYQTNGVSFFQTRDFLLYHHAYDNWNENNVTWNNFDVNNGNTLLANFTYPEDNPSRRYNTFDLSLTAWDFQQDLNDDVVSFMLQAGNEGNGDYFWTGFQTSEAPNFHPYLEIQYSLAPEPVSTVLFLAGAPLFGFGYWRKKQN